MVKIWKTFEIVGAYNTSLLMKREVERKSEDFKYKEFIKKEELKDLVLKIDFDGAISTRELLKEIGYDAPDLNKSNCD